MKWMFKLLLLLATAWSGYWYFGAKAQEKAYASLMEESRAAGWLAESRNLGVQGFPNRFDTNLTDLNFQDPNGRWGWQGEAFNIKALSYKPNHIIVDWPGQQVLSLPSGQLTINSALLRASIVVAPELELPLTRLQIEGEALELEISQFGKVNASRANLALFQDETTPTLYRLGVEGYGITPPADIMSVIGGGAFLPDEVEYIHLSASLGFNRVINRLALQNGTPPYPVSATLAPSVIIWGDSKLTIEGEVSESAGGRVYGSLEFEVENWQPLYEVFKQASNLTTTEKLNLQRALDAAAGGQNLQFTVGFNGSEASIGPFVIGPAPRWPF